MSGCQIAGFEIQLVSGLDLDRDAPAVDRGDGSRSFPFPELPAGLVRTTGDGDLDAMAQQAVGHLQALDVGRQQQVIELLSARGLEGAAIPPRTRPRSRAASPTDTAFPFRISSANPARARSGPTRPFGVRTRSGSCRENISVDASALRAIEQLVLLQAPLAAGDMPLGPDLMQVLEGIGVDFSVDEADLRSWLANPLFTPYPAISRYYSRRSCDGLRPVWVCTVNGPGSHSVVAEGDAIRGGFGGGGG
ncbi:hypothetical protein ABT040_29905 [Streptomyces sp. NPDC002688]|uniref:hypothetical protein n=1 Tax=Streptomyces sp. NPDC002688 TaxID=3154423 RepID=UPI00333066F2